MNIQVQKFYPFRGFLGVKLKDYEVKRAIERKESLVITKGQEVMIIPNKEIKVKIIDKSESIPSKLYPGTSYELWSFKWQPKKRIDLDDAEQFSKLVL